MSSFGASRAVHTSRLLLIVLFLRAINICWPHTKGRNKASVKRNEKDEKTITMKLKMTQFCTKSDAWNEWRWKMDDKLVWHRAKFLVSFCKGALYVQKTTNIFGASWEGLPFMALFPIHTSRPQLKTQPAMWCSFSELKLEAVGGSYLRIWSPRRLSSAVYAHCRVNGASNVGPSP